MSTLSDLIAADDDAPSSQPQQYPYQQQQQPYPPPQQHYPQYNQPQPVSKDSAQPQSTETPMEAVNDDLGNESAADPESPSEGVPKARTELDIALTGEFGDDPLPATPLMLCVDRLYQGFNNVVLDFFPQPGLAIPQPADIKESAEFNVKTFKDACQELTAEFTRTAVEWQLVNPEEYFAEEAEDLRKALIRQAEIQKRVDAKVAAEFGKPNNDKPIRHG